MFDALFSINASGTESNGFASQGVAVVYITHNMGDVMRVTDRIAVMYRGRKDRRDNHQGHHQKGRGAHDCDRSGLLS